MRAAMIHEELLEQRRRLGHDKRDEVWAGVLHMVPPPTTRHQLVSRDLFRVLDRIAQRLGLEACYETGLFDPNSRRDDQEYRVPDLVLASAAVISARGIEGAATLVVEVLSPGDESRTKLGFYAAVGVLEVWIVDPDTRVVEVFALRDGILASVPARGGGIVSPALGIELVQERGRLALRDGEHIDVL